MGSFAYKLKLVEIESIDWKSCSDCSTRSLRRRRKKKSRSSPKVSENNKKNNRSSSSCSIGFSSVMKKSLSQPNPDGSTQCSDDDQRNGHFSPPSQKNYNNQSSANEATESDVEGSGNQRPDRGPKEVLSIKITNGQIDLWSSSRSCLNEWFIRLREACHHSKGRREALMKKSQTLPSPAHQHPAHLSVASNSLFIMSQFDNLTSDAQKLKEKELKLNEIINSRPNSRLSMNRLRLNDDHHQNHRIFSQSSKYESSSGRNSATLIREPLLGPRLAPQCKGSSSGISSSISASSGITSSLVSLDRRLMGKRNPMAGEGGHLFSSTAANNHQMMMIPPPIFRSSNHHGLERRTLLRNAAAVAAANGSVPLSSIVNNSGLATLRDHNQFNFNQAACPRSLQVSPALAQRSLYAQHIFSQTNQDHSSPSPSSNVFSSTSSRRGGGGWTKDDLLRLRQSFTSSTQGRNNQPRTNSIFGFGNSNHNNQSNSSSVMKSATSEFSFVRPDSPLTLPYNKSKSFYGRGNLPLPPIPSHQNLIPTHNHDDGEDAPPIRPPLPRESSTLTRISSYHLPPSSLMLSSEQNSLRRRLDPDVTFSRLPITKQQHNHKNHYQPLGSSSSSSKEPFIRPSSYHYGFPAPKRTSSSLAGSSSDVPPPTPRRSSLSSSQRSVSPPQLLEDLVEKIKFNDGEDYDGSQDFPPPKIPFHHYQESNNHYYHPHDPEGSNSNSGGDSIATKSSNHVLIQAEAGSNNSVRRNARMNRILEKTSLQYSH